MYDDYYYNNDMDRYYYEPRYFEIRSMIYNTQHNGWCLQEAIKPRKHKRNFFVAAVCDGSPSQKFFLDENGYLHNKNYPDSCLKRSGRWLKIDSCDKYDSAAMKWIFATDGTIRFGHQALFAISIPEKYTKGSWLNKDIVPALQLRKIMNRSPIENERWWIIHEEPMWDDDWDDNWDDDTMEPTGSPHEHDHDDYPSNAPQPSPNGKPTPTMPNAPTKPNTKKFNIDFMNMGQENMYNEAFEKARSKFQKMIIGDLTDYPAKDGIDANGEEHDWFAGTWPNRKVNTYIDDVLIGYEITDIDGVGNVLGFAGPLYIRHNAGDGTYTTISGIMKFDREDFKSMSKGDIELIVLHEMAHVLGLGTLWTSFKCGTECIPHDQSSTSGTDSSSISNSNNEYLCDGAITEYMNMMGSSSNTVGNNPALLISPDDCSHWSGA